MKQAIEYSNANKNTGKDVRIVQMEAQANPNWSDIYNDLPISMTINKYETHSQLTGTVIRTLLPDAKIYLLPPTTQSFEWIRDNDIDIVSVSLTYCAVDDELEKLVGEKTILLISSGNNSKITLEAKKDHWTSVGAVSLMNDKPFWQPYSGSGQELDFVQFSSIVIPYDDKQHAGTSFSCPMTAGILGQFIQSFKDEISHKPHIKTTHQFMLDNVEDLKTEGHDTMTGNGLFILPKEFNFTKNMILNDWIFKYRPNGLSEKEKINLAKLWNL